MGKKPADMENFIKMYLINFILILFIDLKITGSIL